MSTPEPHSRGADTLVRAMLTGVQMPLANAEFAIDQHLAARGVWIDMETRILLARLRDMLGEVAASTRRIAAVPPF